MCTILTSFTRMQYAIYVMSASVVDVDVTSFLGPFSRLCLFSFKWSWALSHSTFLSRNRNCISLIGVLDLRGDAVDQDHISWRCVPTSITSPLQIANEKCTLCKHFTARHMQATPQ